MTTIDYKAIAERLSSLADELAAFGHHTSEQKVDDLRTVVSLLNGMADMEPAARIYTDAELVHRDPRWGRVCWIVPECEIDGGALLYLHPAPQPIAIPAPFMHLLGHAYGLSLGTDWNRGTHAKHYRRPLLDAVAECKRWLGSAPQPQPADTGFTLDQPGPWRADSYDPMHIVADMPNGRDVVLVCRVDTNTYKDMGRRNRDLILAAPDLLEALEPFARIRLDTDDLPMDFAELVLRARAAVAKAKGGNR